MKIFFYLVLPLLLIPTVSARGQTEELADRVVIVVNERDPESLRIGEHYAMRRGIPRENIIALDAPALETITRQQYIESIHNPLQRKLFDGGWLTGLHSTLNGPDGRSRSMIEGHRISYLVLCRGIPLRIEHDPAGVTPQMEQAVQKEFLTNAASVDSELALLTGVLPSISFIGNPLFEKRTPGEADRRKVIKVARIDGPTPGEAMALIDSAMEAERTGIRGRAYVDLAGPHQDGTSWLEATAAEIRSLGFDLQEHEPKGVFPITARFDAPALYFGWYANDISGPFLLDGFRFPAGAIAFHIHSFSSRTLASPSVGWVGPFVARGVAATLGNVYEPYLQLSHRPDLFFEWIKEGGNVGDAAAYSIAAFSWQGILVGDPLYRPFARTLEEQLAGGDEEEDALGAYAAIRRMNLLLGEGRREQAIEEGLAGLERWPSVALALAVAKAQVEERDRRRAIRTLALVEEKRSFPPMEVMLAKEVADFLSSLNEHGRALKVYEVLLKKPAAYPAEVKEALFRDGLLLAQRLNRRPLMREWQGELDLLILQEK